MLERRHSAYDLGPLLECDRQRREALAEVETLKARRNEGSRKVGEARKRGEDAAPLMEEMRLLGDRIADSDRRIGELERFFEAAMLEIPNRPHESVPEGADENDNPEIRRWGTPRAFDFEPRPHWEIGEGLGIMDFERGPRLAESRFTVLKGQLARLEQRITELEEELKKHDPARV